MDQRLKTLIGVAAAVHAFFAWRAAQNEHPPVAGPYFYRLMEVGSTNVPVASVFFDRERVLLCLWPDGRIIWSTNVVEFQVDGVPRLYPEGGSPYFEAHVPPERVEAFLHAVATNEAWLKLDLKGGLFPLDDPSPLKLNLETKSWRLFLEPGIDFRTADKSLMESYAKPPLGLGEFIAAYTNIMSGLERLIPDIGGTNVSVRFRIVAKPVRPDRGKERR